MPAPVYWELGLGGPYAEQSGGPSREHYMGGDACVTRLAAGIAHNFNNLLTSMMCGSAWALDRLAEDHPARTAVEAVSRSSEQAADLVRQLMAYAGISPFAASPVDLSQLAARAVEPLRDSLSAAGETAPGACRTLAVGVGRLRPDRAADSGAADQRRRSHRRRNRAPFGSAHEPPGWAVRAAGEYFDAAWPDSAAVSVWR